jgi:hypothetical protein
MDIGSMEELLEEEEAEGKGENGSARNPVSSNSQSSSSDQPSTDPNVSPTEQRQRATLPSWLETVDEKEEVLEYEAEDWNIGLLVSKAESLDSLSAVITGRERLRILNYHIPINGRSLEAFSDR